MTDSVEEVSNALARMITEWVDGGIDMNTDWRPGLAGIIARRLSRRSIANTAEGVGVNWFALSGDARLEACATDACGGQPMYRLEAGGVGSNYCSGCTERIKALSALTSPQAGAGEADVAVTSEVVVADDQAMVKASEEYVQGRFPQVILQTVGAQSTGYHDAASLRAAYRAGYDYARRAALKKAGA